MLKKSYIADILTNHQLIMKNKTACHKFRCMHDLFTLIALLTLVILLSNYVYNIAISMKKGTYSTSLVDLKFTTK